MRVTRITERLSIAAQPNSTDIAQWADQGFTLLINARPDDEEASQPGNACERCTAERAGMAYAFIPVTGTTITKADIRAFQAALSEASGAAVAHCKTGTRALMLFVLGEALDGRMEEDELIDFGQRHGIDLTAARRWLERERSSRPRVEGFFDPRTFSIQYLVIDPDTRACAVIDPVLDFDEKSGATSTRSADELLEFIAREELKLQWILDTHPHADHFSAAHYLRSRTGAPTAIGERVIEVQKLWKEIYHWPALATDGSQWDRLFADGERFMIGNLEAEALFSPGHTLASITYLVGDAAFVHDTLFMPDSGSARADFPGGDARRLWRSIQRILALPDQTRLFTGHDYQPEGRTPRWESSVAEQKRANAHLVGVDEQSYVALRQARDHTLPMPKLILHALQVNIRGGRLPEPETNGKRYLKIPLDALGGAPG